MKNVAENELRNLGVASPALTTGCCARPTRRQSLLLLVQCITTLSTAFAISLFPPFYPRLAEEKGCSATMYGFVLGSNCLTTFLITPFIGRNLDIIGPRFAYITGSIMSGVCCSLSGFLDVIPAGASFIALSIAIRVVSAIGSAGVITSSFTFIAHEFPTSVAKLFSLIRVMMNVGQLAGPALGGALYEVGGYRMPFVVLGLIQTAVAFLSWTIMPPFEHTRSPNSKLGESNQLTLTKVFRIPAVWIAFSVFIVSTMSNGFLSVTLEPQILRQYALNQFCMGLVFGIKDGTSSVSSPLWGWLCDKKDAVKPCILLCCSLVCISYFIIGPFPGVEMVYTLWLLCVTLGLNGVGIAGLQVSGVVDALHEVIDAGYPDDPVTHGCVAGLWSSLSGFGRFLSRTTSGIMVDHIGFRSATTVVFTFHAAVILMTVFYMCLRKYRSKPPMFIYKSSAMLGSVSEATSAKLMKSYEFHQSRSIVEVL